MKELIEKLVTGGRWLIFMERHDNYRIGITSNVTLVDSDEDNLDIYLENGDAIAIDLRVVKECYPEELGYAVVMNDDTEWYLEKVR